MEKLNAYRTAASAPSGLPLLSERLSEEPVQHGPVGPLHEPVGPWGSDLYEPVLDLVELLSSAANCSNESFRCATFSFAIICFSFRASLKTSQSTSLPKGADDCFAVTDVEMCPGSC